MYSTVIAKYACLESHKDSCVIVYITINVHILQNTFNKKNLAWGKKSHKVYKVTRILGQLVHLPTTQDYTPM